MALKALDQRMAAVPPANGPTTSNPSRSTSIPKPSVQPQAKTDNDFSDESDDDEGDKAGGKDNVR